mmetsp:Transcript_7017/g.11787  ORF Transcript_7017/g.11787 Transcript_7017/m.11787 type:complete len:120 (+) Transcript_7017:725-1084(+)
MKGTASPAQIYDNVKQMVDEVCSRVRNEGKQTFPFCLVVTVEIKEDCLDKFMEVMKYDAKQSRLETGCYRFDLLRDADKPNRFVFYEVYKSLDAFQFHKETEHYASWAKFNEETGGVLD